MNISLLTGGAFVLQVVQVGVLFIAAYLARRKLLKQHCLVMRIAVLIQIGAIARVMFPSLLLQLQSQTVDWFYFELLAHALAGLSVIGIWIFINLAFMGVIRWRRRLVWPMRVALGLWLLTFALGAHIYLFTQRL
ncbi:MAG: hypothetical protein HYX80_00375 [Chloroflexi bacterium]|nr:hypothetical protein [Chloroflexota bacterium]